MTAASTGVTTVTEGCGSSIPAAVRRRLDIRPGDRLVWEVEGSAIRVRLRKKRGPAFEDFVPFDFDTTEHHDEVF